MYYAVKTPHGIVIVYAHNPIEVNAVAAEEAQCAIADCAAHYIGKAYFDPDDDDYSHRPMAAQVIHSFVSVPA